MKIHENYIVTRGNIEDYMTLVIPIKGFEYLENIKLCEGESVTSVTTWYD